MENNKEVLATINELLYDEDVLEVLNNEIDNCIQMLKSA